MGQLLAVTFDVPRDFDDHGWGLDTYWRLPSNVAQTTEGPVTDPATENAGSLPIPAPSPLVNVGTAEPIPAGTAVIAPWQFAGAQPTKFHYRFAMGNTQAEAHQVAKTVSEYLKLLADLAPGNIALTTPQRNAYSTWRNPVPIFMELGTTRTLHDWVQYHRGRGLRPYTIKAGMLIAMRPTVSFASVRASTGTASDRHLIEGLALHLLCHPFTKDEVHQRMKQLQTSTEFARELNTWKDESRGSVEPAATAPGSSRMEMSGESKERPILLEDDEAAPAAAAPAAAAAVAPAAAAPAAVAPAAAPTTPFPHLAPLGDDAYTCDDLSTLVDTFLGSL